MCCSGQVCERPSKTCVNLVTPMHVMTQQLQRSHCNRCPYQHGHGIVSQDLFSFEKEDYLVTVYHFSNWIEVDKLPDTLSTTVGERTNGHFSRYSIPSIVHTDNGPQFISREYKDLSSTCNFKHTTSSPYYAKGNGCAEAALKVAKTMLKKSEDFQLALLLYRNTPPAGHTYSPAQRMFCRRTRSTLPTTDNLLNPQPIDVKV